MLLICLNRQAVTLRHWLAEVSGGSPVSSASDYDAAIMVTTGTLRGTLGHC